MSEDMFFPSLEDVVLTDEERRLQNAVLDARERACDDQSKDVEELHTEWTLLRDGVHKIWLLPNGTVWEEGPGFFQMITGADEFQFHPVLPWRD